MNNNNFVAPDKKAAMAHVINLMTIACTDGKVTQEEQQVINNIANAYGLTEEEFQYCSDTCNECLKKGTAVVEMPKTDDEKAVMIKNMVFTMMSDGEISDCERQYVEFIAEKFGFKAKEFVDYLIKSIVDEYSQNENNAEIEEAIALGKEALMNNDIAKAFDLLYDAAHLDQAARRLFLMIPEVDQRLFLLTIDQEEFLEDEVKKGDALAQYTLGRRYQAQGYSFEEARDLFLAAAKAGLGDAIAALSLLLIKGHMGEVEIDKDVYYQGMLEAVDKGSLIGQYYIYKAAIYGFNNNPANPQAVIDNIKEWLNGDESEDLFKVNPTYYEILAMAYEAIDDWKTSADYFIKCVRMGRIDLYHDWLLNTYLNKDYEITDVEGYEKALEKGIALGCGNSHILRAYANQELYDASDDEDEKKKLSKQIQDDLISAADLGEGDASYTLGVLYYYGSYGVAKDTNVAWGYFLDASGMNVAGAWNMMGEMYLNDEAPKELGPHFISYCRLMAMRLGDDDALIPVIISYYGGYLDQYSNEIQKYYLPLYNALPDEVKTEYFGLQFIAAVNPDGKANLIQFDFEKEDWSELEEIIDAKKLEAIHTDQLDQLSKELDFEGRITAWVDRDRVSKHLEPNTIGKKFSPTPILGDIIFTLEDNQYHPMAIDLAPMKQLIDKLGGEVEDVYYEEFPDDDSHNDPQA